MPLTLCSAVLVSGYDSYTSCSRPLRTSKSRASPPCDFRFQSWCTIPGSAYPWHAVRRFVHENQGLMRRMYGDQRQISLLRAEIESNDVEFVSESKAKLHEEARKRYTTRPAIPTALNNFSSDSHPTTTTTTTTTQSPTTHITAQTPMEKIPTFVPKIKSHVGSENSSKGSFNSIDKPTKLNANVTSLYKTSLQGLPKETPSSTSQTTTKQTEPTTTTQTVSTGPTFDEPTTYTTSISTLTTFPVDTTVDTEGTTPELNATDPTTESSTVETTASSTTTETLVRENVAYFKEKHAAGSTLFQDTKDEQRPPPSPPVKLRGVNACPVKEEVVAPFWANNTRGEVLALLNLYPFEQYVHWEKCTFELKQMYCREGCRCEQQYRLHRLLAYDPNNECRGIFSDWFKFPSCCVCKCYDLPADFQITSRSPRTQPSGAAGENVYITPPDWYRLNNG